MSNSAKPSIVFCHGIWADGSCFNKVIPRLQAAGYECIAAQYALNTTDDDVATVKKTLGRVSSPAILVGHSYGGQVITAAGVDDRVCGLVYIAALGPDKGETAQYQQDQFPKTPVFSKIAVADGRVWMLPDGASDFAGDLPEAEQKIVWATHYPPSATLFSSDPSLGSRHGKQSRVGASWPNKTARCNPISSVFSPSAWGQSRSRSTPATSRCFRTPTSCSKRS